MRSVSSNLANTGCGKNHSILEVKPFALLDWSWITGSAANGCVNPSKENDVRSMEKLAFPVTEKIDYSITDNKCIVLAI